MKRILKAPVSAALTLMLIVLTVAFWQFAVQPPSRARAADEETGIRTFSFVNNTKETPTVTDTSGAPPPVTKPYEGAAFAENSSNSATTKFTSGHFQVQVTSAGSGALLFTFTPNGWSIDAVTLRYSPLDGSRCEVQMSSNNGSWQYTASNLGQKSACRLLVPLSARWGRSI